MAYVITASDRDLFRRCRRAWDFGATVRQSYRPLSVPASFGLERAIREALAVHYYPGMWAWNRAIVRPLALRVFDRSMEKQRDGATTGGASGARVDRLWADQRNLGRALLAGYFEWATNHDRFTPIRVDADFEVNVPDPERPGTDLTTPDGEPIRYRGQIDLLVEDERGTHWLVHHRIEDDAWAARESLEADARGISFCWAWERFFLGMRVAGTIYNELRLFPQGEEAFRRTVVPRARLELEQSATELAREAREMSHPAIRITPRFMRHACSRCSYQLPCIAITEGGDVASVLSAAYSKRSRGRESTIGMGVGRGATLPSNLGSEG